MDRRLFSTSKSFRRRYRKKRRLVIEEELLKELDNGTTQTPKSWLWEFSKKILFILTVMYCLERIYAMVIIAYTMNLDCMTTFLETGKEVFKAGVIFYALKAGIENALKIFLGSTEEEELSQAEPDGEEEE